MKWNYDTIIKFIEGKTNVLSLPDTNHNCKNSRGQLIRGTLASSIGNHVVDPHLFKEAGVPKHLVKTDHYASDAVVLGLASLKVVMALFGLDNPDVGNLHVSHITVSCDN